MKDNEIGLIFNVFNHYSDTNRDITIFVNKNMIEIRKNPYLIKHEVIKKYVQVGFAYTKDNDLEVTYFGDMVKDK